MGNSAADDDGLIVLLSPVQLAAVLGGHQLSSHEILMNRLWGGVQLASSGVQLFGGGALLATPEPTTLTKIAGGVLVAHAADSGVAAIRQIKSGEQTKDVTQMAGEAAAKELGASDKTSYWAGVILDVAVPLGAGTIGALRVLTIRAGRISLSVEETVSGGPERGHTLLKHVGRTEKQLRQRLVDEPKIPAASTFLDKASAERAVSNALRVKKAEIEAWTKTARPGSSQKGFLYADPAGRTLGSGVVRATGKLTQMSKVRFFLRLEAHNGKPYFILTAYPEL